MEKMLKYLDCAVYKRCQFENKRLFNYSGFTQSSLFYKNISNVNAINGVEKVKLILHNSLKDGDELYSQNIKNLNFEQRKFLIENNNFYYQNFIDHIDDVAVIHRRFDFEAWFVANKFDKKRMIIEEIYGGMLHLAEHFGWEKEPLHKAFEACKSANYENAWTVEKLGNKTSTNRKFKAKIYVEYDIDEFRTFVIFSDNSGVQLQKTLIHTINFFAENADIPDDIFDILKGKTKWEKQDFVLLNKNNVEIARVKF